MMLQPSIWKYCSRFPARSAELSPQRMPPRSSTNSSAGTPKQFRGHHLALRDRLAARLQHRAAHQRGGAAGAGGAFEQRNRRIGTDQSALFRAALPFLPRQSAPGRCGCPGRSPCFRSSPIPNHRVYTCTIASVTGCAPASLAEQHTERPCLGASGRSIRPQNFAASRMSPGTSASIGRMPWMNRFAALRQILQPELQRIAADLFRKLIHLRFAGKRDLRCRPVRDRNLPAPCSCTSPDNRSSHSECGRARRCDWPPLRHTMGLFSAYAPVFR